MNGYTGKVLRVDLGTGEARSEELNWDWARKYIGCQGLGIRYLYEELTPGVDPLGPDNRIVLMTGPLVGTVAPCAQKYTLVTKSPLTNTFYDSTAGGHLGPELKFAGYDAVIIQGRAEKPVYLLIRDDRVQILNAAKLWGKDTHETEDSIKKMWRGVKVLSIGQAGENLVKFACITSDYYRQNGRGGIGAVFGSKNLKAIAIKGSGGVGVAEPKRFMEIVKKCTVENAIENEDELQFIGWKGGLGTLELMDWTNEMGCLPTRNWTEGSFAQAAEISAPGAKKIKKSSRACCQCPMACSNFVTVEDGPYKGSSLEGPEYETAALLGSNCGIDNFAAIVQLNLICDRLGLDTIGAGDAASWAMECFEKGILTLEDTGGLELRFGNYEALIELIERIALRQGLGDLLAEGVAGAAKALGRGTEAFAMHVKGLELPGYDPRPAIGMGLAFATSPPGATHTRGFPIAAELFGMWWLGADPVELDPAKPENKAILLIQQQHWQAYRFSTGSCDFILLNPEDGLPDEVAAATGWPEAADWKAIGERIINLSNMFSVREGLTKKDVKLPRRLVSEPIAEGPSKGRVISPDDFQYMVDDYYQLRRWDDGGRPDRSKLKELGIEDLAFDREQNS